MICLLRGTIFFSKSQTPPHFRATVISWNRFTIVFACLFFLFSISRFSLSAPGIHLLARRLEHKAGKRLPLQDARLLQRNWSVVYRRPGRYRRRCLRRPPHILSGSSRGGRRNLGEWLAVCLLFSLRVFFSPGQSPPT